MKLLTICIPTYKRPTLLRKCIESVIRQIGVYELSSFVDIYVANDASPDDTQVVLDAYVELDYFDMITRVQNLGMSVNIKYMLQEAAVKSHYQLIMTDDDYLQPDVLGEVVAFLGQKLKEDQNVSIIWTPRFSYSIDGTLQCIACASFKSSMLVSPSAVNAGKYMASGFILSGLIVRAECIDYVFWDRYSENAFFPMLFMGDLLFRNGAYFWKSNIVHHTCLNKCYWERWGKNEVSIELRLFADFVNSYAIMGKRIKGGVLRVLFYLVAFPTLYRQMGNQLQSPSLLHVDKSLVQEAIGELKAQKILEFIILLRVFMFISIPFIVMSSIVKLLICRVLVIFISDKLKKDHYSRRALVHTGSLRVAFYFFGVII